jgi:hypothetical protein
MMQTGNNGGGPSPPPGGGRINRFNFSNQKMNPSLPGPSPMQHRPMFPPPKSSSSSSGNGAMMMLDPHGTFRLRTPIVTGITEADGRRPPGLQGTPIMDQMFRSHARKK